MIDDLFYPCGCKACLRTMCCLLKKIPVLKPATLCSTLQVESPEWSPAAYSASTVWTAHTGRAGTKLRAPSREPRCANYRVSAQLSPHDSECGTGIETV